MLLNEYQISLLQAPITSIWMSSCTPGEYTDIVRLSGLRIAEDKLHIDLYVPQHYSDTFLRNIQVNQKISLLGSSTHTFEAYQVKGVYVSHRACTQEEIQYQKKYMEGFAQNLVLLGIKAGLVFANYYKDPCIAIRMKSGEIYEQTPKPGAGKKIS